MTGPRQGFIELFAGAIRQPDIADDCIDRFSGCPNCGQSTQNLTVPLNFGPFQLQALDKRGPHNLVVLDQNDAPAFKHGWRPSRAE